MTLNKYLFLYFLFLIPVMEGKTDYTIVNPAFERIPLGSITPDGWFKSQLEIQARGLSGVIDEIWPDVAWSQWFGGKMEGWERAPYYLDGFVPLAFGLQEFDEEIELVRKAKEHVMYIVRNAQSDGMLGPEIPNGNLGQGHLTPNDTWPSMAVLKALTQYYEATGEPTVLQAIENSLKAINEVTNSVPLFEWGKYRYQDLLLSIDWLYRIKYDEKWLLDMAKKMIGQGYSWKKWFTEFPCRVKYNLTECGSDLLAVHGVNNAQGLKTSALEYLFSGDSSDRDAFFAAYNNLDRYHGTATGAISCDELLAGLSPSQGTETCTVVEYMFSLETALYVFGNSSLGDRLEQVGYNAMPGSQNGDMYGHPYVQQVNEIMSAWTLPNIYTNDGPEANMIGLAPNYGCCTANYHQGYPKLLSHSWMKSSDDGLISILFIPSTLKTALKGATVTVSVKTNYPFDIGSSSVVYDIQSDSEIQFPFSLRIPCWADGATVSIGSQTFETEPCKYFKQSVKASSEVIKIVLAIPMKIRTNARPNGAISVFYGPVLYALEMNETWIGIDEQRLIYEVHSNSTWNYALAIDPLKPEDQITVHKSVRKTLNCGFDWLKSPQGANGGTSPFTPNGFPIFLQAPARKVLEWKSYRNAAMEPPHSPLHSEEKKEFVRLIPYGSKNLKVGEFPVTDDYIEGDFAL